MKSYEEVLAEKRAQYERPAANTLHRSSLLFAVRPFGRSSAVLTLSNHFRIKRGIESVGMRIWGFDNAGARIFSDHVVLTDPRVYRYDLGPRCAEYPALATCQVEFYSAANLGMPYPAALVNHVGEGFHNVVHAFARTLNDVFEDDQINAIKVAEASIDVRVDDRKDTFLSFLTGPFGLTNGSVELEVRRPGGEVLTGRAPLNGARFSASTIRLSDVFPGQTLPFGSVLKVKTPRQPMFFGRMMGGIVDRADSAFSANHSYYDHGVVAEYLDAPYGYNLYPLLGAFSTSLVFYPIQAPSRLELATEYFGERGESLGQGPSIELESPHGDAAVMRVSDGAPRGARSFRVKATAKVGSRLPSRLSHQVVIGRGALEGSINESLEYPMAQSADAPAGRPYLSWIQGVQGRDKVTRIGLTTMRADLREPAIVTYQVYGESGLIKEDQIAIPPNGAAFIDSEHLLGTPGGDDRYFFVYTNCPASRIKMFSVVESRDSRNCSAEHNF